VVVEVSERGAKAERLAGGLRREPSADVAMALCLRPGRGQTGQRVPELRLEDELVAAGRLDPDQQAVERADVDAGRVVAALERLDQRRAGSCERVDDATAGLD